MPWPSKPWPRGRRAGGDQLRLVDSTPVPCAASRETVKRSALAGHAGYGYCRATTAGSGASGGLVPGRLATPKLGEREVVAALLGHERERLRPGLVILADKGFAGQDFEQLGTGYGAALLRPDRADEPRRHGSLGRFRQWIESTFDTSKTSSAWNGTAAAPWPASMSGGPAAAGLAAGIWWNWQTGQPHKRSLVGYDH